MRTKRSSYPSALSDPSDPRSGGSDGSGAVDWFPFIRTVYFFKDLRDDEVTLIASCCLEEDREPGDIVFVEGAAADRFFIVIEGSVEVWKNYYEARPDLLAVHGPGRFFGEMALIDELPRSATVVVKEPARLLCLLREDFRRLIREHSSIALSVMTSISFKLRSSNETYVEDLRKRNAELEEAYGRLTKAQQEQLRNERLSTLGRFSSLILHDIRNPLASLDGLFQLMKYHLHEPEKLESHIAMGLSELERLERLAGEFLDYSRGEVRLDIGVTDAKSLAAKIEEEARPKFGSAEIEFAVRILYDEPVILDFDRIVRAAHNLLDNSRKALLSRKGRVELVFSRRDESFVIEVRDNGEGMSAETLSHIFEPFYSASSNGGTGLGMLIVKNIIEAHRGTIKIQSDPGRGTTVSLNLPLKS